jgi:murein DD-endopeptidase MepM/ murein hydrolase activator NlpD
MVTSLPCVIRGVFKARYLVSVAAAVMLAACSSSVERFAQDSPNPSDADPVYTASVPNQQQDGSSQSASDGAIVSKPLAGTNLAAPNTYNYSTNYSAPAAKPAVMVPQVATAEPAISASESVGAGGTVTVGSGMTLYSIAKSNGLTVAQLAAANGLKAPYSVKMGQVLRIPGTGQASLPVTKTHSAVAANTKLTHPAAAGGTHQVTSGETLFALGRKYHVSAFAIADLNGLPHNAILQVGQTVKIPGGGTSASVALKTPAASPAPAATNGQTDQVATDIAPVPPAAKPAAADTATTAQQLPATTDGGNQAAASDQIASADAGISGMRWPVRGKIISNFGAKPNGLKNEGINIAVPEGTSIRAADDGVVAYAGNELKGYGNLILIRHAGGYVTAYAHAKELFVKRGDTVKRGDVIAKAGQTGSVTSPQLHFEVRKGATALDPLKYLVSSTALN